MATSDLATLPERELAALFATLDTTAHQKLAALL